MDNNIHSFHCIFQERCIQYISFYPFYIIENSSRNKKRKFIASADGPDAISFLHQFFNDVSAQETCAACNEYLSCRVDVLIFMGAKLVVPCKLAAIRNCLLA